MVGEVEEAVPVPVPVPVAVDVAGPARSQLLRLVEGALGWPVVRADDPVLPPRCVLVDVPRAGVHAHGRVPVVLVVGPDDDPALAARAGRRAAAVLDRVPDAGALQRLVDGLVAAPTGRTAWCTVVASAGGVGATTVATALAGLRAWRHGPTLLATSGPSHHPDAPLLSGADLASPAAWAAAAPGVAVPDLRVVRLATGPPPRDVGATPVVLDLGVRDEVADVLVVGPDRAGVAAAGESSASAVVVVGRGPVDAAVFRRVAPGRPVVTCARSARVAAAAAAGRSPADLPGTWLRPLAPLVERLADVQAPVPVPGAGEVGGGATLVRAGPGAGAATRRGAGA